MIFFSDGRGELDKVQFSFFICTICVGRTEAKMSTRHLENDRRQNCLIDLTVEEQLSCIKKIS